MIKPLALAALLLASPMLAQAATPPAATPLQAQLASKLLDFIEYKNTVQRRMESSTLPPELLAVRPDWAPSFKAAMAEELDHDMPVIESMLGQALGKAFTEDEMKAGLKIVADPALKAIYMAAQNQAPQPQVTVSKATDELMSSPAGSSFVTKLQGIDTVLDPVQIEVMATVMPGVLKRFGDKAEAAEVQKRAAAGYAAALK